VVNLYSAAPTTRAFYFTGLAKRHHTLKIVVLGRKSAASSGDWVSIDGFGFRAAVNPTEESSPAIHYDSWSGLLAPSASGGTIHRSGSPGASVSMEFRGRTLRWVTATGPAYGRARVVIDGKARIFDLYRHSRHWQVAFTYRHLGAGEHHVRITALGRKDHAARSARVVVDALVVRRR
jgi:hypothetical protein